MNEDCPPQPHATPPGDVATPPEDEEDRWRTSYLVPVAILAIVIGLIGGIVVVAQQGQDEGGAALAGTSVDTSTLPVTVPYREVAGAIVIDVTLGTGSRTVPMILDTGAPTIVSGQIAEVFAGDVTGTIATTSVDGQVFTSDVVPLPRLAIGDAVFRDVGAVVGEIKPGNPFYCISEAGFIGASLMQTATWQIDPGSGSVTIAESVGGLDHIDGATRLDFARASDVSPSPLIELATGAGTLTFLLDTGSDGWLVVHPDDLSDAGVALPADAPSLAVLGRGTAGSFTTRLEWSAADVSLGDEVMRLSLGASAALPPGQGIAGTDFLSRFVMTIDWPSGAVYLDPVTEIAPSTPASASLGWDGGYVVGSYVEGLPASDSLELGADVTAIAGIDVTRAPFDDFCTRLTAEGAAAYEMTVAGEVPTTVEVAPVDSFFEPLG